MYVQPKQGDENKDKNKTQNYSIQETFEYMTSYILSLLFCFNCTVGKNAICL